MPHFGCARSSSSSHWRIGRGASTSVPWRQPAFGDGLGIVSETTQPWVGQDRNSAPLLTDVPTSGFDPCLICSKLCASHGGCLQQAKSCNIHTDISPLCAVLGKQDGLNYKDLEYALQVFKGLTGTDNASLASDVVFEFVCHLSIRHTDPRLAFHRCPLSCAMPIRDRARSPPPPSQAN